MGGGFVFLRDLEVTADRPLRRDLPEAAPFRVVERFFGDDFFLDVEDLEDFPPEARLRAMGLPGWWEQGEGEGGARRDTQSQTTPCSLRKSRSMPFPR